MAAIGRILALMPTKATYMHALSSCLIPDPESCTTRAQSVPAQHTALILPAAGKDCKKKHTQCVVAWHRCLTPMGPLPELARKVTRPYQVRQYIEQRVTMSSCHRHHYLEPGWGWHAGDGPY